MDSSAYKGWAKLRPLIEGLVPLEFPLDTPGQYRIGSKDSDSVSLLIPEPDPPTGEKPPPIEATISVTDKGEVFLERPGGQNQLVRVNEENVNAGQSYRAPLAFSNEIRFGKNAYVLVASEGLYNAKFVEKAAEVRRCHVCRLLQESIYILVCGHNICAQCRREGTGIQSSGRVEPARQSASPNAQQIGPAIARIDVPMPMQCGQCHIRITSSVSSTSRSSVAAAQVGKLVSDCEEVNKRRPMCEECHNRRGLTDVYDYTVCETCQQMLCPVCALQRHRRHKLQVRVNRLRQLDLVDQKLLAAKHAILEMEKEYKALSSDQEIIVILERGHQLGRAMTECMQVLDEKIVQSRHMLTSISQRKRALGHGWDQTSQDMMAAFNRLGEEFRDARARIDNLCNDEVSFSISDHSGETNSPSATTSKNARRKTCEIV